MALSEGKGKYLGLPYLVGHSKKEIFNYIRERAGKNSLGWKEKYLSPAGKEVLIKSVLQYIPTYAMSVSFFFPNLFMRRLLP